MNADVCPIQRLSVVTLCALAVLGVLGCSKNPAGTGDRGAAPSSAEEGEVASTSSVIAIDGSSTVFPVTEAVAEEFQKQNAAKVTIGVSGTGGGFKKLCAGEVAVVGASRPIKPTEEQACAAKKVEYIEVPVAYDGLAVITHPDNTWAKTLTVDELKKIWEPGAQEKITNWNQIRAGFPDKSLRLFGPGVDSGTYDYFTKAVVGKEHTSRGDYTSSEDDNMLVQGVSRDPGGLGFLGLAYYEANKDKLNLVGIDDGVEDNGKGAIHPSAETVRNGTYQPLSRPIFVYVSKAAAERPEVKAFMEFYLTKGEPLVREAQYIPLPANAYSMAHARFSKGVTGSVFSGGGSQVGVTVEALLARE